MGNAPLSARHGSLGSNHEARYLRRRMRIARESFAFFLAMRNAGDVVRNRHVVGVSRCGRKLGVVARTNPQLFELLEMALGEAERLGGQRLSCRGQSQG